MSPTAGGIHPTNEDLFAGPPDMGHPALRACATLAPNMFRYLGLFFLGVVAPLFLQNPTPAPQPNLPKDPRQIMESAMALYDYSSLQPFHLKATYQLYGEKEQPGETGSYEYWFVSLSQFRITWTRGSAVHTLWSLGPKGSARFDQGEMLQFVESKLQTEWIMPLPDAWELGGTQAERREIPLKNGKLDCVELIPPMPQRARDSFVGVGWFPTYCFDPHLPALRVSYSLGNMVTEFSEIVKFRDKYLPRQVAMFKDGRKLLTAKLEAVTTLTADNPALAPQSEARSSGSPPVVNTPAGVAQGFLEKKTFPVYPDAAKRAGISGTVVLDALIGRDGGIHDLRVVSAPSPSLAASSLDTVAQWHYRPYLMNGEPVEVRTTINVIFSLSR